MNKPDHKPEIFSYGHRNPQGLAFHPETGVLWETEHGPQGGDEVNIVQAGKNYGWPVASYGREYAPNGAKVSTVTSKEGIEEPMMLWIPSIGASGLIVYTGDQFPDWKGHCLPVGCRVCSCTGSHSTRRAACSAARRCSTALRQRIRDVRQGPDGFIYLAVDANPGASFGSSP